MSNAVIPAGPTTDRLIESGTDQSLLKDFALNCYAVAFSSYQEQQKKLLGSTLTVIDACIPAPQQNKATKDIVRDSFHRQESTLAMLLGVV